MHASTARGCLQAPAAQHAAHTQPVRRAQRECCCKTQRNTCCFGAAHAWRRWTRAGWTGGSGWQSWGCLIWTTACQTWSQSECAGCSAARQALRAAAQSHSCRQPLARAPRLAAWSCCTAACNTAAPLPAPLRRLLPVVWLLRFSDALEEIEPLDASDPSVVAASIFSVADTDKPFTQLGTGEHRVRCAARGCTWLHVRLACTAPGPRALIVLPVCCRQHRMHVRSAVHATRRLPVSVLPLAPGGARGAAAGCAGGVRRRQRAVGSRALLAALCRSRRQPARTHLHTTPPGALVRPCVG